MSSTGTSRNCNISLHDRGDVKGSNRIDVTDEFGRGFGVIQTPNSPVDKPILQQTVSCSTITRLVEITTEMAAIVAKFSPETEVRVGSLLGRILTSLEGHISPTEDEVPEKKRKLMNYQ